MVGIITLSLNPAVDKSCSVEHVRAEDKLRCHHVSHHPGGGGLNVARAVAKLGGHALALWTCGGALGELLRSGLDDEGIDHRPIPIADMTRENIVVSEESSNQQYRFCMPGARLTEQEITTCLEMLKQATDGNQREVTGSAADQTRQYVVLSGSLPPGAADDLYAQIADALDPACRVVVDTSGRPLELAVRKSVYLIKPNIRELGQLAGRAIETDSQLRDQAKRLIDDGKVEVVLTSLGSGGAVLTTLDAHVQIRTPTVEVRSKVGAGDSMVAGMVLALTRGKSVFDAARFGVAAGAAAVKTEGTELCRREDAERLYKEMES